MTTKREPIATDIAAQAADWIVRRDGGEMTMADEAAFVLWCEEPTHRAALVRLEKVWGLLDEDAEPAHAQPLPDLPRLREALLPVRAHHARPPIKPRRHALAAGGIAAVLALVLLGGVQDWPMRLRADHMTGIGERRDVVLADGSHVRLDSGSAIALDYSGSQRRVRLLAGAALFEVAPDRTRPFTVEADGGSVTALGTAFVMRDEGARASVTVTKHSVRVVGDGRAAVIAEGQRADFGRDVLNGPLPTQGDATAWTRGRLVVVDRPLGEVVAEIARYRRGYVAVTGSAAAIRVSGVYDLDHPLTAIDSIEKSLGLSSIRLSDRVIILRR